ncbi:MAG: GAF domain-containing protein [Acidimicrobiales bacterium]
MADAVLGIAGDLSIDVVLERLVHAARDLAGARYAALGVPDDDQGFARFITAGMSEAEVEAMGPLPRTHGLLGAMLVEPEPYRSADVRTDPRFRGWWPSAHPVTGAPSLRDSAPASCLWTVLPGRSCAPSWACPSSSGAT